MQLCIMYLTDTRRHYTFEPFVKLLSKSEMKDKWTLYVLTHESDTKFYEEYLKDTEITYKIDQVNPDNNYMTKVQTASKFARDSNIPYLMKCDNDIYLSSHVLDYMIANLNLLDTGSFLTLGPSLSTGIPSVEYFRKSFLSDTTNRALEALFSKTNMYDRDGVSYSKLNKHTTLSTSPWNPSEFFDSVRQIDHYYKGCHPVRFNEQSIKFINNYIIDRTDKVFEKSDYSIIEDKSSPYLCDSIFCIKTSTYIDIINDESLFVDPYDEVPLNRYCWNNNMGHLFVKNGLAVHINYNWNHNIQQYEKNFTKQLFENS